MKPACFNPDMILYGGKILTQDPSRSRVQALAIKGNEILATGTEEEILPLAGPKTRMISAQGKTVLPGFNDAHGHPWQAGLHYEGLILFGIDNFSELQKRLAHRVKETLPGEWVLGGSYIESQFVENRPPTKEVLDEVSPDTPVVLERIFGASAVNSKALELAGINKDTPEPQGGSIGKDENGEPNGILYGQAVLLVRRAMSGLFASDDFGAGEGESDVSGYERVIQRALSVYKSYGITSSLEAGVSRNVERAYIRLQMAGALEGRVNLMPNWHGFTLKQNLSRIDLLVHDYGPVTGFGNDWVRYGGLKMAIDGGLTSGTALKSWPYLGEEKPRDVNLRLDLAKLDEYVDEAHREGWSVGIHVMGDVAIDAAVDAIYKAWKKNPRDHRHHLIHAYYPSEQALQKMKEASIAVACQASFIYGEADGYLDLLPEDKRESFTPLRRYVDEGIHVALSTDMPCADVNPFWNLYSAVTRKGMRGFQLGTKECISREEALYMMTKEGAYLTGEEHRKGSLEPGQLADIVLVDGDLLECSDQELRDMQVWMTILDGKIIYEKHQ